MGKTGIGVITTVTQERICLFGKVVDSEMRLNDVGRMVFAEWQNLPERFPNVALDAFVVMPNHVHGILVITDAIPVGAGLVPAHNQGATTRVAPTIGDVVGAFKSRVTVKYAPAVKRLGWPPFPGRVWQRNYYEHIIRDEDSLHRIRRYIAENPARWAFDPENSLAIAAEP